jgi:hypothetical protein
MKKNIVLFGLFILPIVAYLFFASRSIPSLNFQHYNRDPEFGSGCSLEETERFSCKTITILSFNGTDVLAKIEEIILTLNEKIYQLLSQI